MTNQTDSMEARLATARERLQAATDALPQLTALVATRQARFDRLIEIKLNVGVNELIQHREDEGAAKNLLRQAQREVADKQQEIRVTQQLVSHLERLAGGDQALEAAREQWRSASAAQVEAAKLAEVARDNLARLDAAILDETGKTAAAQTAQRAAILARYGFTDKPAGKVSAVESALLGSAAAVDALRSARPELELKVGEADAKVATCAQETRFAQQTILTAKQAIAERVAMEALATCRAAVQSLHIATMAATGHPGERHAIYDPDESPAWMQQQADRLKARAMVGE